MKKLIIINGTMGVGKTTICRELYKSIENSVWLDGDWCWMMNPFNVTEENKIMVMDNITHLLNNFLKNSSFEYVIFNWVMHQEWIIEKLLEKLSNKPTYEIYKITLICSEEELKNRIKKDIKNGKRGLNSIDNSLERLKLYKEMDTIKLDISNKDIISSVDNIKQIIRYEG
ncbi:AAA family ATPase [Abyssisolibacter fermentans]|uniref:AAA family ATPase n=1 Tax=Abyssisolibacter fermentans TaxID=1766203 RepID=UPI00082A21D3|nr:AAA family ATPase [Abyssisolibacter fermentans]